MNVGTKLIVLALSAGLMACYVGDPIPVECVCQCEQPPAPAAKAVVPKIPKIPRKAAKSGARDAARAKRLKAKKGSGPDALNPVARRVAAAARRAEGRIARQPGSGEVMKTDERTRKAMIQNYSSFLKGASRRSLEPLKPYLTKRLHDSLQKNLPKYEARFFDGLRDSIAALGKGGLTVKETRDMGRGNVEALVRFGNGHERRVIFFKEDGDWKLNRL